MHQGDHSFASEREIQPMLISLCNIVSVFIVVSLCFSSVVDGAFGGSMDRVYNELASQLHIHQDDPVKQHWVAIAGGPGSGKSTTAVSVAKRLNARKPNSCVVLPLDGFHYSKSKLKELDPSGEILRRRGAPWSFDAELCVEMFSKARASKSGLFPIYDRSISDPVFDEVELSPQHKVVLIEGLYVLLFHDPRWQHLEGLWDEHWFVKAPTMDVQRQRLIQRSLRTWTVDKAKLWGEGELGAAARVDANDVLNMDIVSRCEQYARTIIVTK